MALPVFTTDYNTDIGKVRLILSDLDPEKPIFPDDAQIQAFIDMEGDGVIFAAARALETIAANRVMTMQVIQLLDLKLDGRSTAQALLAAAKQLRETGEDWCGFDIAQAPGDSMFATRDYYLRLVFGSSFFGSAF